MINVFYFELDGILIDSGSFKVRKKLPAWEEASKPHTLLITHYHEDHSGNAAYWIKKYGMKAFAHPLACEVLRSGFKVLAYEKILFGKTEPLKAEPIPDIIQSNNYQLESIHTPGHSQDHVCFFEKNEGWLFSGDMYVADMIKIWRKGENLKQQIESLEKLCRLDFDTLFCAHNPQFGGGKKRLETKLGNFRNFYETVCFYINKGFTPAETMKAMKLKERNFVKFVTFNDVSVQHMIQSVYQTESISE